MQSRKFPAVETTHQHGITDYKSPLIIYLTSSFSAYAYRKFISIIAEMKLPFYSIDNEALLQSITKNE
jgi:hypothetical protein